MVSVVFIYNRWSKSEIRCYVDGAPISHTEMTWLVNTSDVSVCVEGEGESVGWMGGCRFHSWTALTACNEDLW